MKTLFLIVAWVAVTSATGLRIPLVRRNASRSPLRPGRLYADECGNDPEFDLEIRLGTPGQTLYYVPVDTMAADMYVPIRPSESNFDFDYHNSSTFRKGKRHFFHGHEDMGLTGYDVINITTLDNVNLIYDNQEFGLVQESRLLNGRIGLGFPSLSENNMQTLMQNIWPQLEKHIFGFSIVINGNFNESSWTEIIFHLGGMDTENCGAYNYFPISSSSYWQFGMNGFSMGKYSYSKRMEAVIASVEQVTRLAEPHYSAIMKMTGATPEGKIPCDSHVPDMIFTIGGVQYTIPAQYLINVEFGTCTLLVSPMCESGFTGDIMFGKQLMQSYSSVFDLDNKRIGLAPYTY